MNETKYPWHRCVPGTSFFVPSLEPHRTAFDGIRVGRKLLGTKVGLSARPGMYRGLLGVLFSVRSAVRH